LIWGVVTLLVSKQEASRCQKDFHLEWRAGLSDTILKGTHTRTFPARFGLIQFRGFRGEDLNVKVYDVRRTDRRLWPVELKTRGLKVPERLFIMIFLVKYFFRKMHSFIMYLVPFLT
jgi:hypothetical protein